jgi:2-methylcitrate dehydratase PrpD
MRSHRFTAEDVELIECGVRPHSLNILMYHEPKTGLQAKFSAEYWPAITLLRGCLGLREITDEVVLQPEVQALIRKVKVYPDSSITVATARVNIKVTLKDGRTFGEAYFPAKGAADNPLTQAELADKFGECAAWGGIPGTQSARAIELLLGLERLSRIDELMKCLVASKGH